MPLHIDLRTEIVFVPCATCWGQGLIFEQTDTQLIGHRCATCIGTGFVQDRPFQTLSPQEDDTT